MRQSWRVITADGNVILRDGKAGAIKLAQGHSYLVDLVSCTVVVLAPDVRQDVVSYAIAPGELRYQELHREIVRRIVSAK